MLFFVKISITAEDVTQQTFKAVRENSKSAFESVKSSAVESAKGTGSAFESLKSSAINTFNTLKTNWLAATAAITGAMYTINKAWNLAEQAAQFQEQKTALNNLASSYGTTADSIISSVRDASDGLISMADATKVASKALMTGLKPDQLVDFMKIVKETTNVTGASVSESFERIIQATAAGQERALKQMGIIIDLQGGYKKYAESVGKTTDELTEMERQQAGINTILGKSSDILKMLGDSGDSTADKMERFKVMIADISLLLGEVLVRAGLSVYGIFQGISTAILGVVSGLGVLTDWLALTSGVADAALEASIKLGNDAAKNISTLWEATETATKKIVENKDQTIAAAESVSELTKKEKKEFEDVIKAKYTAWKDYYDKVQTLHSTAIEEQKKKTQELLDLEEKIKQQRQGYADLELSLKQKLMTESEKYYSTQENLEQKYKSALLLSGQAKIDALTDYQKAAASAAQEVKDGDEIIISMQDSVASALYRVKTAQEEIVSEQEKVKQGKLQDIEATKTWVTELESAMNQAQLEVYEFKTLLDSIPSITQKTILINTISDSGDSEGSYASGTSYVPATGLYQLHQGEKVLNRNEVTNYNQKQNKKVTINMGDIVIRGTNKTPDQLAKEIVKPLQIELQRLNAINN